MSSNSMKPFNDSKRLFFIFKNWFFYTFWSIFSPYFRFYSLVHYYMLTNKSQIFLESIKVFSAIHKNTHRTYKLFTHYFHNSCFKIYFLKLIRKVFFIIFFVYIKMVNIYYQKDKQRREKKHVNDIKIILNKKKIKSEKRLEKDIKILLKKKIKRVSVLSGT